MMMQVTKTEEVKDEKQKETEMHIETIHPPPLLHPME